MSQPMNKKIITIAYIIILILLAIVSCSKMNNSNIDDDFKQFISYEDVNSKIKFTMPDGLGNEYKIGGFVSLWLTNHTNNLIIFPPEYGLKLFIYNNGEWIQVENNMIYHPHEERHLLPKDQNGFLKINCVPIIRNHSEPVLLRVLVVGSVQDKISGDSERVAAYYDVKLYP